MKVFVDANLLIYLNVGSSEAVLDFWIDLLARNRLYTDPLVLDEVIWVSRKKYSVLEEDTIGFIEEEVLPFVRILPIGEREYVAATDLILSFHLKPSDALHAATMKSHKITSIASEDAEFDRVPGIRRLWLRV